MAPTERAKRAQLSWQRIVEEKHRRLGMTRRQFAESACGMAAALYVLNAVNCGSSDKANQHAGGAAQNDAGYDIDAAMLEDADRARERLAGDEFIFDVQVHVSQPLSPWSDPTPPERALDFMTQVFVQSSTSVACLSGVPQIRNLGPAHVEAHQQVREIIERFGGPRLVYHANANPDLGASELEYMAALADRFAIGAFKVYPHAGAARLDDDELGGPFLAQAEQLGIKVIAAHRGISGGGGYQVAGSPLDVVRAATKFPGLRLIVYHSGWEPDADENHPYDAANPEPTGVDRFIRALQESGLGAGGNVYAELGTTWYNLMNNPAAAAHVLGKLLSALGPDRVLFGTDSVFNGVPESQIVALRTFVIPESMQETYGYPALTDEVRRKIFGLNAADAYGVDPEAVRYAIAEDDIEQLRLAYLDDSGSVPIPDRRLYAGPRTRREFFALHARERAFG